jgi:hypothetical protein
MNWFYNGINTKSIADLNSLVHGVLLADDFDTSHLVNFSAARKLSHMDKTSESNHPPSSHQHDTNAMQPPFFTSGAWKESSVILPLPKARVRCAETDAPQLEVPGVMHHSITECIRSAFEDPVSLTYHLAPYEQCWKPSPDTPSMRVFGKMMGSQALLDAAEEIRAQPQAPGPTYENVVAPILLFSDSTHLANFGTASLWPVYAYFGNQSKYVRGQPSSFAAHHLAYIPPVSQGRHGILVSHMNFQQLPANIQDTYIEIFGESPTEGIFTHLKRELVHAVWQLLLDGDFMSAYEHGIVIKCADGITRRVFPRFVTYSADYQEKYVDLQFSTSCLFTLEKDHSLNHQIPWQMSMSPMLDRIVPNPTDRDKA